MNPRHVLLVAVLASTWWLAPQVHASGNDGHGHDSTSQGSVRQASPASPSHDASSLAYGDNGDAGLPPAIPSPHPHAASGSSTGAGNCESGAYGIGSLFSGCSSQGSGPGNANDNGDAGMGWQSMLPGSIQ